MNLRKIDAAGHELDEGAATAYAALLQAARSDGVAAPSLSVISAFRTREKQEALYADELKRYEKIKLTGTPEQIKKYGSPNQHVSPPGRSAHQQGIAVDLSGPTAGRFLAESDEGWKWMHGRAADFGWSPNPNIDEPWHWVWKGSISSTWASIPSWLKWGTAGAIAMFTFWPSPDIEAA